MLYRGDGTGKRVAARSVLPSASVTVQAWGHRGNAVARNKRLTGAKGALGLRLVMHERKIIVLAKALRSSVGLALLVHRIGPRRPHRLLP